MARVAVRKIKAIEYLGGKCQRCGIKGHYKIYDFHHKDPNRKDFKISASRKSSIDDIKAELDKCLLVCSNCHRILHDEEWKSSGKVNVEIFEELLKSWDSVKDPRKNKKSLSCPECRGKISNGAKMCKACRDKKRRAASHITWPPVDKLIEEVQKSSVTQVARNLGASRTSVRKKLIKAQ